MHFSLLDQKKTFTIVPEGFLKRFRLIFGKKAKSFNDGPGAKFMKFFECLIRLKSLSIDRECRAHLGAHEAPASWKVSTGGGASSS